MAARWDARQRVDGGCQEKAGKGRQLEGKGLAVRKGRAEKDQGKDQEDGGDRSGRQAILPSLEDSGMTMMSVLTLHYLVFLSSHR